MIWIVSKKTLKNEDELSKRHEYIFDITQARTSKWQKSICFDQNVQGKIVKDIEYYRCKSYQGEYGIILTAHIDEVISILKSELSKRKKAYVIINSCKLFNAKRDEVIKTVRKNFPFNVM